MSLITQMIGLIGIGLLTGSVVGLTGASGVVVVVPLLTVLSGFSMHTAIGTSLFVDVITPLFVAWSYYKNGNVNIKSGLWLALGAIVGAQIGSLLANQSLSGGQMGVGFIVMIFIMAIAMWRKSMLPLPLTVLGMVTLLHALACPLKTETKDSTLHSQRQCFSELAT